MGEQDITEKLLENHNDVFSDIINGLIFEGRHVVGSEELMDLHPVSQYSSTEGTVSAQERDVFKDWKHNLIGMAVLGVENQTEIYKPMPIRVIGYDGSAYRKQLSDYDASVRIWNREHPDICTDQKPEFHPVPVITLVLYFGKRRWRKNRNLKELLSIPKELEPYVNDYRINLFEISWLSEEQISRFTSDFRVVANFFVKRRTDPKYVPDDLTEIIHVQEVMSLLASVTGDKRYLQINDKKYGRKVKNMDEVAERLHRMGKKEGKAEGKAEGIKIGEKRGEKRGKKLGIIESLGDLVKDGLLPLSEAAKRAHMTITAFKSASGIK